MKPTITFAALVCALAAAPAAAQDEPAGQVPRPTSVSLEVGGGYAIGVWRDVSPRVRAGIEVGTTAYSLEGDGSQEELNDIFVQPGVKLFSAAEGAVRPYTMLGVYARQSGQRLQSDDPSFESEWRRRELGARIGLGLEWLPVSRFSVGGHVGVGAGYLESRNTGQISGDDVADGWTAGTFTSGVVLHLFL